MKNCIICDIDGVYVDSREWSKYLPKDGTREEWDEFHAHCEECSKPNKEVIDYLSLVSNIYPIIFITSREDRGYMRYVTEKQIFNFSKGIIKIGDRNKLLMRKDCDYRKSSEVKEEYLKELFSQGYHIIQAIDDDLDNIEMFEKYGIETTFYDKFINKQNVIPM